MQSVENHYNPFQTSVNCPKCQTAIFPLMVVARASRNLYVFECGCGTLIVVAVAGTVELLAMDASNSVGQMAGLCLTEKQSKIVVPKGVLRGDKFGGKQ